MSSWCTALALCSLAALVAASSSSASFPGRNGKIAFVRADQIYTVSPDGSGLAKLSKKGSSDRAPSWSQDGTKIAYQSCCRRGRWQIWMMSETGAGKLNLSSSATSDTARLSRRMGRRSRSSATARSG